MKKIGEWVKKEQKKLFIGTGIVCIIVFAFLLQAVCFSENRKFECLTKIMFQNELEGNTLSLHYTLKNPRQYGIKEKELSFGDFRSDAIKKEYQNIRGYLSALQNVDRKNLSKSNQLTYDILELYFKTELTAEPYILYEEPLGATIGIQAQLPVLLAEYRFETKKDIKEYLNLMQKLPNYYRMLAEFEEEKAASGLFMSDRSLEHILQQCQEFIGDIKSNYLLEVFDSKIDRFTNLTEEEKIQFKNQNRQMVESCVIPAYQILIERLEKLKGTGNNEKGLCFFPEGKDYYEYLVKRSTGDYDSIEEIEHKIQEKILSDFKELQNLAQKTGYFETINIKNKTETPEEILNRLQEGIHHDFPDAVNTRCKIKYVHHSMEDFLSPAFYLTPPIDDIEDNVIYINNINEYTPLQLFTTLAHEGFPGHLYQTTYFANEMKDPIRAILNFGGYVEGWATYVEMYAYGMAEGDKNMIEAERLNRSIMLGISTLIDISIHYHGCSRETIASYLGKLGITSDEISDQIYDTILEAPANYLQYYVGYLNFEELKNSYQEWTGENFTLKKFHQKVLEIGPSQFPILEKYLKAEAR